MGSGSGFRAECSRHKDYPKGPKDLIIRYSVLG